MAQKGKPRRRPTTDVPPEQLQAALSLVKEQQQREQNAVDGAAEIDAILMRRGLRISVQTFTRDAHAEYQISLVPRE